MTDLTGRRLRLRWLTFRQPLAHFHHHWAMMADHLRSRTSEEVFENHIRPNTEAYYHIHQTSRRCRYLFVTLCVIAFIAFGTQKLWS